MKAQFEVDEMLWGKVRVAALLRNKTLGELISPLLEGEFGNQAMVGEVLRGRGLKVPKSLGEVPVAKVAPTPVSETSKAVPEAPVVDIYSIERKNCSQCGESFPVNILEVVRVPGTIRSKSLCKSCIDNMRNGQ